MLYGIYKPSFTIAFEHYLVLARQPKPLQEDAHNITKTLHVSLEQANEFLDKVKEIRARFEREAARHNYKHLQERRDELNAGLSHVQMAYELGVISGYGYTGLVHHGNLSDFLVLDRENLERVNWKKSSGVGSATRQQIAHIYQVLGVENLSLCFKEQASRDLEAEKKEMIRILKKAGISKSVVRSLFHDAAPTMTQAQYEAARRILKGHVPAAVTKVLLRVPVA